MEKKSEITSSRSPEVRKSEYILIQKKAVGRFLTKHSFVYKTVSVGFKIFVDDELKVNKDSA